MYLPGGHLYVYFTYGMHFCMNVVTGGQGRGEAVLIRAAEPLEGLERMRETRGRDGVDMTNGPAKLCQALSLGREQNGTDLTGTTIFIAKGPRVPASSVGRSARIGITTAREKKWRLFLKDSIWVSR
jgi:DNA-3-methyladenine glycosylase